MRASSRSMSARVARPQGADLAAQLPVDHVDDLLGGGPAALDQLLDELLGLVGLLLGGLRARSRTSDSTRSWVFWVTSLPASSERLSRSRWAMAAG